ncbi:MAG: zeta toxin family protein [Terriglobia bacterium]
MAKADWARASGGIYVLAGCNGAGKSSIGGAALRQSGGEFFNPDVAAPRIAAANTTRKPPLTQPQINGTAWNEGRRLLQRAIDEHADFAFETTLGGKTMTALLEQAAHAGLAIHIWFVGLTDVELHIDRVRRRVAKGGHNIPAEQVRERFQNGRVNLIRLLPHLTELCLYDNSAEADPDSGGAPLPRRLLYYRKRRIVFPTKLKTLLEATPAWAKPIVAAAIKLHLSQRR